MLAMNVLGQALFLWSSLFPLIFPLLNHTTPYICSTFTWIEQPKNLAKIMSKHPLLARFIQISTGAHLASPTCHDTGCFFCPVPKVRAYFWRPATKSLDSPNWHWLILAPMGANANIILVGQQGFRIARMGIMGY